MVAAVDDDVVTVVVGVVAVVADVGAVVDAVVFAVDGPVAVVVDATAVVGGVVATWCCCFCW